MSNTRKEIIQAIDDFMKRDGLHDGDKWFFDEVIKTDHLFAVFSVGFSLGKMTQTKEQTETIERQINDE